MHLLYEIAGASAQPSQGSVLSRAVHQAARTLVVVLGVSSSLIAVLVVSRSIMRIFMYTSSNCEYQ